VRYRGDPDPSGVEHGVFIGRLAVRHINVRWFHPPSPLWVDSVDDALSLVMLWHPHTPADQSAEDTSSGVPVFVYDLHLKICLATVCANTRQARQTTKNVDMTSPTLTCDTRALLLEASAYSITGGVAVRSVGTQNVPLPTTWASSTGSSKEKT